ncbi:MAG: hypothetical protein ABGW50_04475 [Thermococcus sp.]
MNCPDPDRVFLVAILYNLLLIPIAIVLSSVFHVSANWAFVLFNVIMITLALVSTTPGRIPDSTVMNFLFTPVYVLALLESFVLNWSDLTIYTLTLWGALLGVSSWIIAWIVRDTVVSSEKAEKVFYSVLVVLSWLFFYRSPLVALSYTLYAVYACSALRELLWGLRRNDKVMDYSEVDLGKSALRDFPADAWGWKK